MQVTRRAVVVAAAAWGLSSCAPDPTIQGAPAAAHSPTPATQAPETRRAAQAVAVFQADVDALARAAGAPAGLAPVSRACNTYLDRLLSPDPLVADQERTFPAPTVPGARAATLPIAVDRAVKELRACLSSAVAQPHRLLHASLSCAVESARLPGLAAAAGGGTPVDFPDSTREASLEVALSRVWALVEGTEIGLGRLGRKDPLHVLGGVLLNRSRTLRNDLREAATKAVPRQEVAYRMPNPMSTPEQIRAGWAQLQHGVLEGLARLAATDEGDSPWTGRMLAQVRTTQSLGGSLERWPGWAQQ